jgi:putative ATP-dependent endonuclease of OLD family
MEATLTVIIEKIKLINFKRFENYTICPNERINILVGDNEVGKSSILEAIDLVALGSVRKVENIGLDKLMNINAIRKFAKTGKFEDLPKLKIELYLKGTFDHTMNGKNNSLGIKADGIRLTCAPNEDYITEINNFLSKENSIFPYEYYKIRFSTFADESYSSYKKKLRTVLIDSTNMDSDYATNDFIKRMYNQYTEDFIWERLEHKSQYRQMKSKFCEDYFSKLNNRVPADKNYLFGLQSSFSNVFSQDLMIYENEIAINNKGTGKQVLIKTDFALERAGENVDVVLIEEPENHLSHGNLKKLIANIAGQQNGQIFITTHNSLISTGLDLYNLIILSIGENKEPLYLKDLNKDTANYFLKAPPASILEFVLSSKTILVEGPSEYILLDKFYYNIIGRSLHDDGVNVLAIRGLSFKRYLDISKITNSKVAIITDNDGNFQMNCRQKYQNYHCENIGIYFDIDNTRPTFEYFLYEKNKLICDDLFGEDALEYMLNHKTDSALKLSLEDKLETPEYIKKAIKWINE